MKVGDDIIPFDEREIVENFFKIINNNYRKLKEEGN